MKLTRLVKKLTPAFLCLIVWLKIIKLHFLFLCKSTMARVTMCVDLKQIPEWNLFFV